MLDNLKNTETVLFSKRNIVCLLLFLLISFGCGGEEAGSQWQGGRPAQVSGEPTVTVVSKWLILNTGGTGGMFRQGDIRRNLLDVAFWRDGQHGAASGAAGAFYTNDGGLTWKRIKPDPRKQNQDKMGVQYYQVEFLGPQEILLAEGQHPYMGRHLWHSTDAGQTWEDATKRLPGEFKSIWDLLVHGKHVWLLGGWDPHASYHSDDGGKTWSKMGLPQGFEPFRVVIPASEPVDEVKIIYILGALKEGLHRYPQLLRSDDGGGIWEMIVLPNPKKLPWGVSSATMAFATPVEGMIGLTAKGLKFTSHGTWEKESESGASVLVTSDGGLSWIRRELPNKELMISSLWLDPDKPAHGFAGVWNKYVAGIGSSRNGPALYETFNNGKTWTVAMRGKPHINAIVGFDAARVWAVGDLGGFYENDVVAIIDVAIPAAYKINESRLMSSASIGQLSKEGKYRQLLYSTRGPVKIEYELPANGYVTLVVEKEDGTRVRNLIGNYPRKKGRNIDYWDGCDDSGNLLSTGKYLVRGLYHGELDVFYEFSYGTPGNPPWHTTDSKGGWLANHTNPMAVLADEKRIYVAAAHSEGPHALMALDYQGNKIWGGLARWYGGFLARHSKYLYVINDKDTVPGRKKEDLDAMAEIELIRVDPETGREVFFPDGKSRHVIAKWNIQKEGAAKKWEGWTNQHKAYDADWAGINAQGLAAIGDYLYASLHFSNKLLKIDAKKGEVIGEIPLPFPAGLVSDGKRLLAISETKVVEVKSDGTIHAVIKNDLKAPIDLALDKKGNIYVSDWADQMQVKVFSPDGEYLNSIGKLGGRPLIGPYDPRGMFLPRGISVDTKGRLWVAEDDFSPRRVSSWNPDGTLAIEKVGGSFYAGMGTYIFPDEPAKAFSMGNLLDLDWEKGRWRVASTPWRAMHENALLGLDSKSEISGFHRVNGRKFLIHTANAILGGVTMISEWKNNRAKPLAAVGGIKSAIVSNFQDWKSGFEPSPIFAKHLWTEPRMNEMAQKEMPWFFHGPMAGDRMAAYRNGFNIWQKSDLKVNLRSNASPNANFSWHDLNGNGLQDNKEINYYSTPKLKGALPALWTPEFWSHGVADKNLTLYLSAIQGEKSYHFRLPVSRWVKSGTPVYEPEKAELIVTSPYLGQVAWVNEEGQFLAYGNFKNSKRKKTDPLVMFNPDGSVAWTYPSDYTGVHGSFTAPQARHGLLIGPLGIIGHAKINKVGEIFAFHTNMGQAVIFTEDGLYLGELFTDSRSSHDPLSNEPRSGMSVQNTSLGGEWFGGQFFQNQENKNIYVVGIGRVNSGIGRVVGLESTKRLANQNIDFTQKDYSVAAKLLENKVRDSKEVKAIKISKLKKTRSKIPKMEEFSRDAFSFWHYDEMHSAEATWTYDENNLYVCFKNVTDNTPMINSGEDVQQLFKFGDAALLELRTVPDNKSSGIIPGDLRILFSVYRGKPIAVLYNYRAKGVKKPVHFRSVKDTVVDVVKVLSNANVIIDRKASGYSLRASIPLNEFDFKPLPGKKYRGDFGIVHSDKTGMINNLRMNWANKATGLVSDLSIEADITPQMWGEFEVK